MNIYDKFLELIQKESGYGNPLQTRPKPTGGITGKQEDPENKEYPLGVRGPSGAEVDLDDVDNDADQEGYFKYKYKD